MLRGGALPHTLLRRSRSAAQLNVGSRNDTKVYWRSPLKPTTFPH